MKRRAPEAPPSLLPANLAAGPTRELWGDKPYEALTAWRSAGWAWERTSVLEGGQRWTDLLPEPVRRRYAPTVRERLGPPDFIDPKCRDRYK